MTRLCQRAAEAVDCAGPRSYCGMRTPGQRLGSRPRSAASSSTSRSTFTSGAQLEARRAAESSGPTRLPDLERRPRRRGGLQGRAAQDLASVLTTLAASLPARVRNRCPLVSPEDTGECPPVPQRVYEQTESPRRAGRDGATSRITAQKQRCPPRRSGRGLRQARRRSVRASQKNGSP